MNEVAKSLRETNEFLAALIGEDEETETVEKSVTREEFLQYAKEQVDKARKDDDPTQRLEHLSQQIEKAMGFDDTEGGGTISIWRDSSLSLSGQSAVADMATMHGEPPGARPAPTLPAAGLGVGGQPGSFDDSGTNPVPAQPNTAPGGTAVPATAPAGGGDVQSFGTMKNVAKSKTGWESDLSSQSFLDLKPNNIDEHLDFGPDAVEGTSK